MIEKHVGQDIPLLEGGGLISTKAHARNRIATITAWAKTILESLVPFGYEDAQGFHIEANPLGDQSGQCSTQE